MVASERKAPSDQTEPETKPEVAPRSPELSLLGTDPRQQLDLMRDLSRPDTSDRTAAALTDLKLTDSKFKITNGLDGKPAEFTSPSGTWKRANPNDDTWVNKGDSDHPRIMRGTPSVDAQGNLTFKSSDFGTTQTHFASGGSRVEMTNADGQRFAIERDSSGKATRLQDHTGTWTSKDGKMWRDEHGNSRHGEPSMSDTGEYSFRERGKETFKAASAELSEARDLQKKMEDSYGVKITPPGTKHEYGTTSQPSARELKALEEVLDKSKHIDLKGLQISFLGSDKPKGIEAEYGDYADNKLNIFQNARVNPEGWLGLKGVGMHEIVHKEQDGMGKDDWRGKNPGPEIEQMRKALGWEYHQKFGPVLLDKDGGMWSPSGDRSDKELGPKTNWKWVDGTPPKGKHTITAEEMEQRAKVKPATPYNNYPYESHAEAAAMYRMSPEQLAGKSPAIYTAIRDWDQRKLDERYGAGQMVRDVEGRIVRNTPEVLRRRQEMEQRYL